MTKAAPMPELPFDIATCTLPTGTYTIGSEAFKSSRPAHRVELGAFAIMRYAVSNLLYYQFEQAGGYTTERYWSAMGWRWRQSKSVTVAAFRGESRFNRPQQPVVGVSWYAALAFARWLTEMTPQTWRLPTEAEFEAAARGHDDNSPIQNQPHVAGRIQRPITVDTSAHVAACGAVNLLGNVWEWTSSRWGRNWQSLDYAYPYDPDDGREDLSGSYARVMRGGSWFDAPQEAHPARRGRYLPGSRGSNIGFRLVHSVVDAT